MQALWQLYSQMGKYQREKAALILEVFYPTHSISWTQKSWRLGKQLRRDFGEEERSDTANLLRGIYFPAALRKE